MSKKCQKKIFKIGNIKMLSIHSSLVRKFVVNFPVTKCFVNTLQQRNFCIYEILILTIFVDGFRARFVCKVLYFIFELQITSIGFYNGFFSTLLCEIFFHIFINYLIKNIKWAILLHHPFASLFQLQFIVCFISIFYRFFSSSSCITIKFESTK